MDQSELRQWEQRCIQEEPPPCMAACPLHVDARAFIGFLQGGRWADALKTLHRVMPLPGILGRICDTPCQRACNRKEAGEAIRIGDLERACVSRTEDRRRVMPLPAKTHRIAVVGSGLSSLTAAWDLARKGYPVTVYVPEQEPAAFLLRSHPQRLSREIIEREIRLMTSLGVRFKTGTGFATAEDGQRCRKDHAAVYVGLDAVSPDPWAMAPATAAPQGSFGTTGDEGLFSGGDHPSPVWQAAQGRWAATTMDRWLQKVSPTAGREKEGPQNTRLYTNLQGITPLVATVPADPTLGYSETEALEEAGRCIQCQCLECVKVCAYLEHFGAYPKRYVREIYNNEALVLGERKANRLINSCSLCGLCEAVCPHDFAMQDLCLAARQSMVGRSKMPPSAHDFALQDMAFSQSERFALARHEPGRTTSRYLFFPGCQLCASAPGQVPRVYDHLRHHLTDGVALMLGCCGAPAHWAGQRARFADALDHWKTSWDELGRPRPVMACASCLRIFRDHLPEADPISLWEILDEMELPPDRLQPRQVPLAVHDPCTTRGEETVQDAVRRLLARMGVPYEELQLGRAHTECCGFGGLMQNANPALAREVAEKRGSRSGLDYLAYCAMCRDNLAAVDKRSLHLLDLLFPDPNQTDPSARPRPGWSRRRENRLRLREHLARELWNEPSAAAGTPLVLQMDSTVVDLLDARRILREDIEKVLRHVQKGGQAFHHPDSGHWLACFRPYQATFWVEYSPLDDGYRIHNAYAHRMEVPGP